MVLRISGSPTVRDVGRFDPQQAMGTSALPDGRFRSVWASSCRTTSRGSWQPPIGTSAAARPADPTATLHWLLGEREALGPALLSSGP
ncbi:hypothetical protein DCS_04237 [Drechmeria coniospora]|uniref:Uncharacterized protein n=1 Tax=Drechmeria coniospora TaxID=98403 RepID=A0A151GJF0_DRECN|nr:hypothetical protein DCS_04237 [Drechmeria coniospora]KYK57230.1 hypothetical protein DCS_04237 [Drechmeria coniospora]